MRTLTSSFYSITSRCVQFPKRQRGMMCTHCLSFFLYIYITIYVSSSSHSSSNEFAVLLIKHSQLFYYSLDVSLPLTSVSLFLCRQTNYAQKPWRTHWIQCGMKRWCITASPQQTWPPKRSGRHPALSFPLAIPARAKIYFVNDEDPYVNPSGDLPIASLLPSELFQVL